MKHRRVIASLMLCGVALSALSLEPTSSSPPTSGDVQVTPFLLPPSSFASEQSRRALTEMIAERQQQHPQVPPPTVSDMRAAKERELRARIEAAQAAFPVAVTSHTLAGVAVDTVEPKGGVPRANRSRVIIELAGGAFTGATHAAGVLESMLVAATGQFRVISVHYRQGPEYHFPAASEDVAAVYGELLKSYKPAAIGIYGCSSGAYLTTMALAWFQAHHLPRPGAVALLCGSAGRIFEGDSYFTAPAEMGGTAPKPVSPDNPIVQVEYMRDINASDPLAMPINFPEVLAKFPPTLFITGTRDGALSSAVYLHSRLVALGVVADLHVWDGMWHGFMNRPELPETKEAAQVISNFFDQKLSR